eukprot:g9101.t1
MDTIIPHMQASLDSTQLLALFLAAIGHDVGHRGKNNAFEITTHSELAVRYNDISVLENHHAAVTSEILHKHNFVNELVDVGLMGGGGAAAGVKGDKDMGGAGVDLDRPYGHLTDAERAKKASQLKIQFRKLIINAILGTDMSKHGELLKKMQTSQILTDNELLIVAATHCADLGAQLGIPVTPFMTGQDDPKKRAFGQVQFIEFVVMPLWKACSEVLPTRKMLGDDSSSSSRPESKEHERENVSSAGASAAADKSRGKTPAGGLGEKANTSSDAKAGSASAGDIKMVKKSTTTSSRQHHTTSKEKAKRLSEWIVNLQANLEAYKFVAKHGKRRQEMSVDELKAVEESAQTDAQALLGV